MAIKPTFSVIIRNYNYDQYIESAIQSVLDQTRSADEIIVVDDGSTDKSRELISRFGMRIVPIFQKNLGMNPSANVGYARSSGSFVLFLDSDDRLYPDALDTLERASKPGISKLQFDLDLIGSDGIQLGRRFCNFKEDVTLAKTQQAFEQTGTYPWPVTSGNAYSRKFLDQVMPLEKPPVGHDGVLNTIAPLYGNIVTIPRSLGQYRIHNANASRLDKDGKVNFIPDFASRIKFRKREFEIMRQHARRLNVAVPAGDLLLNELTFVNYRLMARKIKNEDLDDATISIFSLWKSGLTLLRFQPLTRKSTFLHACWITVLAIAPAPVAASIISLRYRRDHWKAKARSRLGM